MIALRILGPVEVTVDGRAAPPELLWRKNLALLVYLARSPKRTRSREHLMGLLWGERPDTAARHSLREAIRVLRQAGGETILETEGDQLKLAGEAVTLDADRLERHVAAGEWPAAAALATGELLEGFSVPDAPGFEDWLATERLTARRHAGDALHHEADATQRAGDLDASLELARRALALDPASEPALRALLTALALRGDRAAALAAYDAFAIRLRDTVAAEPGEATRRLADQVRRERVWRRPDQPASGAATRRAPLVGRDALLARALDLWAVCRAGRATTLLLEGPAGVGRSRLADEIAARARLDGAAVAQLRGAPADRAEPWSGVFALARGGLLDAPGVGAASRDALAAFAAREDAWADRFPAARSSAGRQPGAALIDIARAAAAEQPLVLLADDAHWLDAESLETLYALPRDAADRPLLVVLTTEDQPPREEIDRLRARLGREAPGASLALAPLGPEALHALAHWAMPSFDAVAVDRLARRLAADSAGLPLLAVELLHAVALGLDLLGTPQAWPEAKRTLTDTRPGDLPDTVVAAIRMGFRRLSKDAQAVIAAAAVVGDPAAADRLARATGLGPDAMAVALDEAEWQRWLEADGRGYRFVARVAREVVARDMVTPGQKLRMQDESVR